MSKVRLTYKPFLIYKGKYFWLVLLATCLGTVDACTCVQTEKICIHILQSVNKRISLKTDMAKSQFLKKTFSLNKLLTCTL